MSPSNSDCTFTCVLIHKKSLARVDHWQLEGGLPSHSGTKPSRCSATLFCGNSSEPPWNSDLHLPAAGLRLVEVKREIPPRCALDPRIKAVVASATPCGTREGLQTHHDSSRLERPMAREVGAWGSHLTPVSHQAGNRFGSKAGS